MIEDRQDVRGIAIVSILPEVGWSDVSGQGEAILQSMHVEKLEVYNRLCQLHIEVCDVSSGWPAQERYELASQVRRSSNSAPAQLAEKHDDRHVRNRIEGVNRCRGETGETIHHLYIAQLKDYITVEVYAQFRGRYKECVRMLNGLERSYERRLPERDRKWPLDLSDH